MLSDTVAGNYKVFFTPQFLIINIEKDIVQSEVRGTQLKLPVSPPSFLPAFSSVFKGICQNITES